MVDLTVLAADGNARFALQGAFRRPAALAVRPFTFEIFVHPQHDGGARATGVDILRLRHRHARHALLVFDHEGCGDHSAVDDIEARIDAKLSLVWDSRAKAIIPAPEVDILVWGSDQKLAEILRWQESPSIREWLSQRGFRFTAAGKPERPKEAFAAMLYHMKIPRSSALYEKITSQVSLFKCTDPAFLKLRNQLRIWFPPKSK